MNCQRVSVTLVVIDYSWLFNYKLSTATDSIVLVRASPDLTTNPTDLTFDPTCLLSSLTVTRLDLLIRR